MSDVANIPVTLTAPRQDDSGTVVYVATVGAPVDHDHTGSAGNWDDRLHRRHRRHRCSARHGFDGWKR